MTEIRIPVKGAAINAVLVIDTDDIDVVTDISANRGFDEGDDGKGHVTRVHNGENSLSLRIKFKPWRSEKWEKDKCQSMQ